MCFITKKHQIKGTYIAKTLKPPPPLLKKKNVWLFRGGSKIFNGGWLIPSGHQTICKSTSNCPLFAPKSCKLGTEDYLESAVFPPPPHHHHPHISIVFTPPIVFLPDRPKSGLKGQSQAKKVKLK